MTVGVLPAGMSTSLFASSGRRLVQFILASASTKLALCWGHALPEAATARPTTSVRPAKQRDMVTLPGRR